MIRRALLAALLAALAPAAGAQSPAPFAHLDVRVAVTAEAPGPTLFHEFWRPGTGAAAMVSTPFYGGAAELGVVAARYGAVAAAQPDFTGVLTYAGWGLGARLGRVALHGGVRVGVHRMTFEEDTFVSVRNESELALGAAGRAELEVASGWAVFGEAAWTKTYTYLRLQQVRGTAGLRARLTTPGWLRRVLE